MKYDDSLTSRLSNKNQNEVPRKDWTRPSNAQLPSHETSRLGSLEKRTHPGRETEWRHPKLLETVGERNRRGLD